MKTFKLIALAFILCTHLTAYAQDGVKGGKGDDGLDYRLITAKNLAIEALTSLQSKLALEAMTGKPSNVFVGVSEDIRSFYLANSRLLIAEAHESKFLIKPQAEVQSKVGGVLMPRKAITQPQSHADILLSREANLTTPVAELTAILLHEIGHHTGYVDENEAIDESDRTLFLNRFAYFLLEAAGKENNFFKAQLYGNVPTYQLIDPSKRQSFGDGTFFTGFLNQYSIDVSVDLKNEKIVIYKSKINEPLIQIGKPKCCKPMTVDPVVMAEGKITPEAMAQFYEKKLEQISLNVMAGDPKDQKPYQLILNFEERELAYFTLVPLKGNLPQFRKSKTYESTIRRFQREDRVKKAKADAVAATPAARNERVLNSSIVQTAVKLMLERNQSCVKPTANQVKWTTFGLVPSVTQPTIVRSSVSFNLVIHCDSEELSIYGAEGSLSILTPEKPEADAENAKTDNELLFYGMSLRNSSQYATGEKPLAHTREEVILTSTPYETFFRLMNDRHQGKCTPVTEKQIYWYKNNKTTSAPGSDLSIVELAGTFAFEVHCENETLGIYGADHSAFIRSADGKVYIDQAMQSFPLIDTVKIEETSAANK